MSAKVGSLANLAHVYRHVSIPIPTTDSEADVVEMLYQTTDVLVIITSQRRLQCSNYMGGGGGGLSLG